MVNTSLFGIAIRVERSWLLTGIVTTVVCGLLAHLLIPDLGLPGAIVFGLALALAFSASLLVHELAHARAAMNVGIEIEHIRFFAGGALCRRREHIDNPRHQFSVAAAGPIISITVGLLALIAVLIINFTNLHEAIAVGLWMIAFTNALLAVTNLLPVFPFDGSKLVHAIFWRASRDRRSATERLRNSGREFSRIVFALGILLIAVAGDLLVGTIVAAFGVYLLRLPDPE